MIRTTGAWLCTAISLATVTWLCPVTVEAQSDAAMLAELRACGAVEGDRDRLACFDRALAAGRAESGAAQHAAPAAAAEPTGAPAAKRMEPSAVASAAALAVAVEESAPAESASVAASPVSRTTEPVAARPANAAPVPAQDAGADQPRIVTIVEVNAALAGAARFVTDTGQLIVQTSGGTPRGGFPDVPFDAELQDGAFGSLFLAVDERRRVRVVLSD